MKFARALAAFLALPGLFAFVVPFVLATLDPWRRDVPPGGLPILALGVVVLLACVRDFYVAGKGTLAPWDPPKRLVIVGLYRYTRNPMYIGVLLIVVGEGLFFTSPLLFVYAAVLAAAFHLRVLWHEEPWLERTFGRDWTDYHARVGRWIPRF